MNKKRINGSLGPQPEETSKKIKACEGKEEGDDCHFMTDSGHWSYGKCRQQFLGSHLYCSNLNKTRGNNKTDDLR